MISASMTSTITLSQCCWCVVIALLISLARSERSPFEDEFGVAKRTTSHSHNIMRFGRAGAGHNIMHFGKRMERPSSMDSSQEAVTMDSADVEDETESMYPAMMPMNTFGRNRRAKYFVPHAFVASLYTNPRHFLKKAAENRDNVFMHFG